MQKIYSSICPPPPQTLTISQNSTQYYSVWTFGTPYGVTSYSCLCACVFFFFFGWGGGGTFFLLKIFLGKHAISPLMAQQKDSSYSNKTDDLNTKIHKNQRVKYAHLAMHPWQWLHGLDLRSQQKKVPMALPQAGQINHQWIHQCMKYKLALTKR